MQQFANISIQSKVSPNGKIAQRDVGAKLVIVMVGLPARGKSYITKKIARYLNWLQHDTKIFNVGERRRVAAGGPNTTRSRNDTNTIRESIKSIRKGIAETQLGINGDSRTDASKTAAHMLMSPEGIHDGVANSKKEDNPSIPDLQLPEASEQPQSPVNPESSAETIYQSASFFDPKNRKAAIIREQAALDALDDLLDYILIEGGSIGILDATNSTLERRKLVMKHIRERAGPDLNVLFMESLCVDQELLERNM